MSRKKRPRLTAGKRQARVRDPVTVEKLDKFIELYSTGFCALVAARRAGLTSLSISRYRRKHPEFEKRWQEAHDEFTRFLEGKAERMAADAQATSPVMLIFLLKARKPAVYRDNVKVEHGGSVTFASDFATAMENVTRAVPAALKH